MNRSLRWSCLGLALFSGCSHEGAHRGVASQPSGGALNSSFERRLPDEDDLNRRIVEGMLAIQQSSKDAAGLHRGTHAKGACVGASLEVYDLGGMGAGGSLPADVVPKLKRGIFSVPGRYDTVVRFANAEGTINLDSKHDVRAVSLAVSGFPAALSNQNGPNGTGRMDFALNDHPIFPIPDAKAFADLMEFVNQGPRQLNRDQGFSGDASVAWALGIGAFQENTPWRLTPYQQLTYWSDVPFQLGADEAVKYVLAPCAGNPAQSLNAKDPNTLADELFRHVNQDARLSCFDFQVQLLDPEMRDQFFRKHSPQDWVEDATLRWSSPAYTVARLTLASKSALDGATCEKRRIDVTRNSNDFHRGLGSINRARTQAEDASAQSRGADQ